jgi:hypothetical protein
VPATPLLPGAALAPVALNVPNLQLDFALIVTPAATRATRSAPDAHDGFFMFGFSREAFAATFGLAGISTPVNKPPHVTTRPASLLAALAMPQNPEHLPVPVGPAESYATVFSAEASVAAPGHATGLVHSPASALPVLASPPAASSRNSAPFPAAHGAAHGAGAKRKADVELSQSSSAKRSRTYCASWDDETKDKVRFHTADHKAKNAALVLLKKEDK